MATFVPEVPFRWWKADGTPAYNWTAAFYEAGTDPISANLKAIYADIAQTTPIANPAAFDVEGKMVVALGPGGYKRVIRDENDVVKDTLDNLMGAEGFYAGFGCQFVDTIADLKALDANSSAFVYVAGYFAAKDGGGGMFRWNGDASTADNGGYTISPDSDPTLGRWERIPDETDQIRAKAFGVIPDGSTDRSARLIEADTYAASVYKKLLIEGADDFSVLNLSGAITLTARIVEATPGFILNSSGSLTFSHYWVGGHELRFSDGMTVTFSAYQINDAPEQFNAVVGASDNLDALNAWKAAGGGAFVLPPGDWDIIGEFSLPNKPTSLLGRIIGGDPTIETGFYFPDTGVGQIGRIDTAYGITMDGSGGATRTIQPYGANDVLCDAVTFILTGATGLRVISGLANVDGKVMAGQASTGGVLEARAGISSSMFAAAGRLFYNRADAPTSGTGATTLLSNSVKANTLNTVGDALRFKAQGIRTTNSGENIAFTVFFGTATLFTFSLAGTTNTAWTIEVEIIKTASNTLAVYGNIFFSGAASNTKAVGAYTNNAVDVTSTAPLNADHNLFVSASTSDATYPTTQQVALCDFFPQVF